MNTKKILVAASATIAIVVLLGYVSYAFVPEMLAKKALADVLHDSETARYRNVHMGLRLGLCGEVNAKNLFGAYVGYKTFVVTPTGKVAFFPEVPDHDYAALLSEFSANMDESCGHYFALPLVVAAIKRS